MHNYNILETKSLLKNLPYPDTFYLDYQILESTPGFYSNFTHGILQVTDLDISILNKSKLDKIHAIDSISNTDTNDHSQTQLHCPSSFNYANEVMSSLSLFSKLKFSLLSIQDLYDINTLGETNLFNLHHQFLKDKPASGTIAQYYKNLKRAGVYDPEEFTGSEPSASSSKSPNLKNPSLRNSPPKFKPRSKNEDLFQDFRR